MKRVVLSALLVAAAALSVPASARVATVAEAAPPFSFVPAVVCRRDGSGVLRCTFPPKGR